LKYLVAKSYADRTQYLEVTTLKQAIRWLIKNGHLATGQRIDLPMRKAEGTGTYCWRREEVLAMLEHCQRRPELEWLAGVVLALAATGLRISELVLHQALILG
jgi:site-specific recombinase XerD